MVSRMEGHWRPDRHQIVLFVNKRQVGIPDPIQEGLSQPWITEYLASAFPMCKVRAKHTNGTKLSICRDWLLPRGKQIPEHRFDVQFTALDGNE